MNSSMMMVLLPFLLAKSGGQNAGSGFSLTPELLASIMGGNAQNPMAMMLAAMIKNKTGAQTPSEQSVADAQGENVGIDVGNVFGKDVANVLRTFTEMRNHQSVSV